MTIIMDANGTAEFICTECRQSIVSYCHVGPALCATCKFMPGWFNDAHLAVLLHHDPVGEDDGNRTAPGTEPDPADRNNGSG